MTPAQLQQLIERETRFWRPAIEKAGLMRK
jgi:hypothetical protein